MQHTTQSTTIFLLRSSFNTRSPRLLLLRLISFKTWFCYKSLLVKQMFINSFRGCAKWRNVAANLITSATCRYFAVDNAEVSKQNSYVHLYNYVYKQDRRHNTDCMHLFIFLLRVTHRGEIILIYKAYQFTCAFIQNFSRFFFLSCNL